MSWEIHTAREDIRDYIKSNEGLRLKPYRCSSGKLTIGFGRNLEDKGITISEADMLLNNDIEYINDYFYKYIDNYRDYKTEYKTVLTDMAYNMGISGLMGFKRMLKAMREGNNKEVIKEIKNSNYYKQVRSRADKNILTIMEDK